MGREGLTSKALRALLLGPGPVVILGMIWPSQYHKYMTLPTPGVPDMYECERDTLALATVIDVPGELSAAEMTQVRAAARHDPALAAALNTSGREVFRSLAAGGPHLVRRWTTAANVYAKAVITGAVNVCREGARGPLSADEIHAAALTQLTTLQLALAPADWFEEALAGPYYSRSRGYPCPISEVSTLNTQINGYKAAEFLIWHQDRQDSQPRRRAISLESPSGTKFDYGPAHVARDNLEYESLRRHVLAPVVSHRELDVLISLCHPGLSADAFVVPATAHEIAADLGVSEAAVKHHLLRLYQKFKISEGPNRRTRLANEVIARGLIRPPTESGRGRMNAKASLRRTAAVLQAGTPGRSRSKPHRRSLSCPEWCRDRARR